MWYWSGRAALNARLALLETILFKCELRGSRSALILRSAAAGRASRRMGRGKAVQAAHGSRRALRALLTMREWVWRRGSYENQAGRKFPRDLLRALLCDPGARPLSARRRRY